MTSNVHKLLTFIRLNEGAASGRLHRVRTHDVHPQATKRNLALLGYLHTGYALTATHEFCELLYLVDSNSDRGTTRCVWSIDRYQQKFPLGCVQQREPVVRQQSLWYTTKPSLSSLCNSVLRKVCPPGPSPPSLLQTRFCVCKRHETSGCRLQLVGRNMMGCEDATRQPACKLRWVASTVAGN